MRTKNISTSLKPALKKLIDDLPEKKVEELIQYLQNEVKSNPRAIQLSNYLDGIIEEDRELLKRLAK